MNGIVITDEMKRAAVIAHLEWEHHKDHWAKVVEAVLALVPHPPEGGKEMGEPVAWLVKDALYRDKVFLDRQKAQVCAEQREMMSDIVPLYTSSIPARDTAGAEGAIRKAGQVAIDKLIDDRLSEFKSMPSPDDLRDYLEQIVDACVSAALTAPVRAAEVKD